VRFINRVIRSRRIDDLFAGGGLVSGGDAADVNDDVFPGLLLGKLKPFLQEEVVPRLEHAGEDRFRLSKLARANHANHGIIHAGPDNGVGFRGRVLRSGGFLSGGQSGQEAGEQTEGGGESFHWGVL